MVGYRKQIPIEYGKFPYIFQTRSLWDTWYIHGRKKFYQHVIGSWISMT